MKEGPYTVAAIGRINPSDPEPLRQTITCPKMVFRNQKHQKPTMSVEQCTIRLEINAPCTKKCRAIDFLRKK